MSKDILLIILSAFISGFIVYQFGIKSDRRRKRNEVADRLYEIFYPLVKRLRTKDIDAINIIEPTIDDQRKSVQDLKRHLSRQEAKLLQDAWECYYFVDYHGQSFPFIEQYADCGSLDKRKQIRSVLIKRLEAILEFSKQK